MVLRNVDLIVCLSFACWQEIGWTHYRWRRGLGLLALAPVE
jgi:hypothetical protein